jgi:phosphoglycerate dehydrogenase-like enzyme
MSLVWVPFHPDELPEPPDGLVLSEVHDAGAAEDIDQVEVFVPPYDLFPDLSDVLPRMTSLRLLQVQTAGTEHVEHLVPAGVQLCNARGVHDASTAELAVTLILASLRGVPDFVRAQPSGAWLQATRPALADSQVVVIGAGSIAGALKARLEPFECQVVLVGRTAREGVRAIADLPDMLPTADVVVVLVPLTDETHHLVDAQVLAALRDGALLVNVARGAIVDTDALVAETSRRRLLAALDVTDPEPLPPGHPLWTSPGVLISPHVGGATTAMAPRMRRLVTEQLRRYAAGKPLANVVVPADR